VIVAALKSRRGASYKLLISLTTGVYRPNISVPLFLEYESVAKRTGLVIGLNDQDINDILDYILCQSSIRQIFYLWRPFLKDPLDDLVLEVAVESQSEYIVTFNKKDFSGIERFGIKVVTPQEFMAERGMLK
jgi:predicted nucleic acid-binding protein